MSGVDVFVKCHLNLAHTDTHIAAQATHTHTHTHRAAAAATHTHTHTHSSTTHTHTQISKTHQAKMTNMNKPNMNSSIKHLQNQILKY